MIRTGNIKVLSTAISFSLEDLSSISVAAGIAGRSIVPVSFSTVFSKSTPESISALREVLQKGRPVDIEIETGTTDASLEGFEEFLTQCTKDMGDLKIPPIILCEWRLAVLWDLYLMNVCSESSPTSS